MATEFGLTPEGFIKMRLPEIRAAIVADLQARLTAAGITVVPETRPDSVFGQLIDTFAERESAVWEQMEAVYLSMYPNTAYGISLDRSVSFTGVERLRPEPSRAALVLYGTQGTSVPAGSQARNSVTQTLYATESAAVISAANAVSALIMPTVQNSTAYTVTIDATAYTYTSDASATLSEILDGLVAALSIVSGLTVTSTGSQLRIEDATTNGRAYSLTGPLSFTEIGSAVTGATLEDMAESAAVGQINQIVTLVSGWARVTNRAAGVAGREVETDAELVARYSSGVFQLGAATFPSLAPNVRTVTGVTDVVVRKNDTDGTVDGLLPHSVQFIVDGGLDAEVALEIYEVIAAGIATNGAVVQVLDTDEGEQTIKFDRPAPEYVWVKVVVTPQTGEADEFPADGLEQIKAGILSLGQSLSAGDDVLWQSFFAPVYAPGGVASAVLTFAHSSSVLFVPAPGDYSAANIPISAVQRARFAESRITVS